MTWFPNVGVDGTASDAYGSGTYSGSVASLLFGGSWTPSTNPGAVLIDLGTTFTIVALQFGWHDQRNSSNVGEVDSSPNNSIWTSQLTFTTTGPAVIYRPLAGPVRARYWRLYPQSSSGHSDMNNFQLFADVTVLA